MEQITIVILAAILIETSYLTLVKKNLFKKDSQKPIFVDTSALIDGRIITIAQSGFMNGKVYIPRSVIGEMQFMADNSDSDKRTKARHGLDIVVELQNIPNINVSIFHDSSIAKEGVDERLLNLAKKYGGSICTIDYNLNKVAQVEGIVVLNVNDLAMGLRMAYLPGEKAKLELTQKGNDLHQAVGHLADGTMVVVERANRLIGKTVEVEFIRSLQTAAGKMMFAKLVELPKAKKPILPKADNQTGNKDNFKPRNNYRNNQKPQNSNPAPQNTQNGQPRKPKKRRTSQQSEQNLINLIK